jgi:hypothetical protein
MKRNSFSGSMYGVVCLAGMISSSAFAACTSVRPTTTSATVTCTSATDQITFGQDTNGYWFHSGPSGAFGTDTYDWDTTVAGDTFMTAGANTITVNIGGGSLTIGGGSPSFGNTPQAADVMNGTVNWSAAGAVTFDSTLSAVAHTYNVDDSPGATTVGSLTFNDASIANITILTGSAVDTVNVLSVYPGSTVTTSNTGGGDAVNIGKANSVQAISGTVTVTDPPSFSIVAINNGADTTVRTATITYDSGTGYNSITGLAPATIKLKGGDINNVGMTTGTQADTVNVQGFYSGIGALTLDSSGGADAVNFGSATGVQNIFSPIHVHNTPSHSVLAISDAGDATGRSVVFTGTGTTTTGTSSVSGMAPAVIDWNNNDVTSIALTSGNGVDNVAVQVNIRPLTVDTSGGTDTITVGDGNGLQDITGSLFLTNSPYYSNYIFNDSPDSTARTATYDNPNSTGSLAGVAPVTINWQYASTVALDMGTAADTVNVHSTAVPLTIQGTNGADAVVLGDASNSAQSIQGAVSIHNTLSYSIVEIIDTADTTGRSASYSATGISGLTPAPVTWGQIDVQGVYAFFGSGDDTVHVTGSFSNGHTGGVLTYISTGDGANQMYINGAGLGANSTNDFVGGNGNDFFDVTSAVKLSQNVTAVNIFGGNPTTFPGDQLDYFAAASSSGTTGTLTPADPNALAISYNSIEYFDYNDEIFKDGFQ